MKIENVIKKFNKNLIYSCPKCKEKATINSSLLCQNNHNYDFSKKGYIHLISNYKATKYIDTLFLSRNFIFSKGYYNHIINYLISIIGSSDKLNILDVGCGEGYYISNLKKLFLNKYFFGLDSSKDAIEIATKNDKLNPYLLANLSNLPFYEKQIDIILNILTPANYEEFFRVLKDDGILIKIIPTKNYLKEIRSIYNVDNYTNDDTVMLLKKYCKIENRTILSKTFELDKESAKHFLNMTPITFSKEITDNHIESLKNITIELEILIAKNIDREMI